MYLHLGHDTVIRSEEIVGIFDLDNTTVSKISRDYLTAAQKEDAVVTVGLDLPKTFVIAQNKKEKNQKVYLCPVAPATLQKRTEKA